MDRPAIERALARIEGQIVGLRRSARAEYGGSEKSSPCRWSPAAQEAMQTFKDQANQYRAMLAGLSPKDGK